MKFQIKSLALGFFLGCFIPIAAIFAFLYIGNRYYFEPTVRLQSLPSGKVLKITSFMLV